MRARLVALDASLVAVATAEAWATRSLGGGYALAAAYSAAGALMLRRRLPLLAFAATLPALSLGYIWLAPMGALYTIAANDRRSAWHPWLTGGCTATVAAVSFAPWPWLGPLSWDPASVVLAAMMSALLATAPTALGLLTAARRELAARLRELAESREHERQLAAEQAVVRERARLAREMHDTVSHHISLIAVQSGALEATAQNDAARTAAGSVRQLSGDALDELRRMVGLLRLPVTSQAPSDGPGLAELPALLAAAGPDVHGDLKALEDCPCPPPVQHAAYRTVQEALTNIRKHAPGAKAHVTLRQLDADLLVCIRNGPGALSPPQALPSGGHGLAGLRERATNLGGTLHAAPEPDGGFLVRAALPLAP